MNRTFLDIPIWRYALYICLITVVSLAVNLTISGKLLIILNVFLSAIFTVVTGVLSNFLPKHKGYESLFWLATKLKIATGNWIKPELDDDLGAYIHKHLGLGEAFAVNVLVYLMKHTITINKTFFPNSAGMSDAFLRNVMTGYNPAFRQKLREELRQQGLSDSVYKVYDRAVIYNDLQREAGSDKRLIKQLKALINQETISLRFADFFHSSEFERSTPYLIIGKYANTQKGGETVLTDWIMKHPSIANKSPFYVSMPPILAGGSLVQYLFLPNRGYHTNAFAVFQAIRQEYESKGLDIEKVFLSISSVFHESNYIHIGKKIENLQSLTHGLRQFLFFKTSNHSLTSNLELGHELMNNLDHTTVSQIIEKLPLTFYLKGMSVSPSERSYLDKKSADFYARFGSMKPFMLLSEGERLTGFAEVCDGKHLRYKPTDLKSLKVKKPAVSKDPYAFKRKRIDLICTGIVRNFGNYEKLLG